MSRWNQGLVIALCVVSTLLGNSEFSSSTAVGQQPTSATPRSYYHRPDRMHEPDEFLARARQTNSHSVLQQYEAMLQGNQPQHVPSRGRYEYSVIPAHEMPPRPQPQLPSRLVPPGVTPDEYDRTAAEPRRVYADPGFSLSAPVVPHPSQNSISPGYPSSSPNMPQPTTYPHARIMTGWNQSPMSVQRIPGHSRRMNRQARIMAYQDAPAQDNRRQDDRPQNRPGDDPFDEPPQDVLGRENQDPQQGDPFADPPADILQNQQIPDPFDDPPADMQTDPEQVEPQPPEQVPVQDPLQGVDPFPTTPDDLDPNAPPPPPTDPSDDTNQVAPERPPNQSRDRGPRNRTGPYESFNGYQPKRLLPAPPDRYFPDYQQPIAQPYFMYEHPDEILSQPTLIDSGFETGQLYEGINYDPDTRHASYQCDSCGVGAVNRRMPLLQGLKSSLARFTCIGRPGQRFVGPQDGPVCDDPCLADDRILSDGTSMLGASECGDCGMCRRCRLGRFNLNRRFAASDNYSQFGHLPEGSAGCCCEPMFYYCVFGGYAQLEDSQSLFDPNPSLPSSISGQLDFDDGFGIGVSLGQWQGRNLRTEIEYAYRTNDLSSFDQMDPFNGPFQQQIDGHLASHAGMFNTLWDFSCQLFHFRPYVGAGVGFAFFDFEANDPGTGAPLSSSNDDSSFAYQFIVGGSRCRSWNSEWFVEYRYFAADSVRLDVSGLSGDSEYQTDNLFLGYRKRF